MDPCNECLGEPCNKNSEKPIHYESDKEIKLWLKFKIVFFASLVLGGVLRFMVSSLCVDSSMNERGEEDDWIYLLDV